MAASSGVRCATFFDAASTFLNNDATVAEESAARPRLLPARERKSRRVRTCASTNQSDSGGGVQSLSSRTEEGAEPTKHGEMTRYEPGVEKRKSNFKFWSKEYREREPKKPTALAPLSGNRAGL